jgi:HAE1 family hydrophobic/amphiphilic exporter-1
MVENRKEKSRAKRQARRLRKAGVTEAPRHAVGEPDDDVPADAEIPDSSGGAHEAPSRASA